MPIFFLCYAQHTLTKQWKMSFNVTLFLGISGQTHFWHDNVITSSFPTKIIMILFTCTHYPQTHPQYSLSWWPPSLWSFHLFNSLFLYYCNDFQSHLIHQNSCHSMLQTPSTSKVQFVVCIQYLPTIYHNYSVRWVQINHSSPKVEI